MSDPQRTATGPAEEADKREHTTDADRTASATPEGDMDEAGEDEQIEDGLVDRALEEPPD